MFFDKSKFALMALVGASFFACNNAQKETPTEPKTADSTAANAPAPEQQAETKPLEIPAALSKLPKLDLPFTLKANQTLDNLKSQGWSEGKAKVFQTAKAVGTLKCVEILDDGRVITFEAQLHAPDGSPLGQAQRISHFSAIASSGDIITEACDIHIDGTGVSGQCKDQEDAKRDYKYVFSDKGLQPK